MSPNTSTHDLSCSTHAKFYFFLTLHRLREALHPRLDSVELAFAAFSPTGHGDLRGSEALVSAVGGGNMPTIFNARVPPDWEHIARKFRANVGNPRATCPMDTPQCSIRDPNSIGILENNVTDGNVLEDDNEDGLNIEDLD